MYVFLFNMFKLLLFTITILTFGGETLGIQRYKTSWFEVPNQDEFFQLVGQRRMELNAWERWLLRQQETALNVSEIFPNLFQIYDSIAAEREKAEPEVKIYFQDILRRFPPNPQTQVLYAHDVVNSVSDIYSQIFSDLWSTQVDGVIPMRYFQVMWKHFRKPLNEIMPPRIYMGERLYPQIMLPRLT